MDIKLLSDDGNSCSRMIVEYSKRSRLLGACLVDSREYSDGCVTVEKLSEV